MPSLNPKNLQKGDVLFWAFESTERKKFYIWIIKNTTLDYFSLYMKLNDGVMENDLENIPFKDLLPPHKILKIKG